MSLIMARAKSAWLLAFADVVTLLITFFIMTIALHKGEISKLQRWVEQQITESYLQIESNIQQQQLDSIEAKRSVRGIVLTLRSDEAFESASYIPTQKAQQQLKSLAEVLTQTPLFAWHDNSDMRHIIDSAKADGMHWWVDINAEGHTDNDRVDPLSPLRNNFFLSTLRAQNVMQLLHQYSALPVTVFSVSGYGPWQPLASNANAIGKAKNRRVEIVINASFQQLAKADGS
ncbi:OmpA/MotB family protein [Thiomicrorhabdus sediminis]|uniref:OmpA-like domain-containing protein n=1 Tax=Thiomicrorhabdus sediminis TaxID=2580412 RepID=A0A4V1HHL9_9GAMM|nr:flagellar motor protein MotB [Thiomicrorhabdus sediminis]QCU89483.1 hypothetical protein FE785_01945 [Thiomicrorhabdus sediminis]